MACNLSDLRPLHKCQLNPITGRSCCPWGQKNCNCPFSAKKKKCPTQICDAIYEEILKSHASTPPRPEWRNTDITKLATHRWEIAKCFINAPGYSDKQSAADIDIASLLHFFINNKESHQHFSNIKVFDKMREQRNLLFHSPLMTLDTAELNTMINDIISVLQDKTLKTSKDAINAVQNLKELQNEDFYITTQSEADVLKTAMAEISKKTTELNKLIDDARQEMSANEKQAVKSISTAQEEGLAEISSKVQRVNTDISARQELACKDITSTREQVIKDITSRHEQAIADITSNQQVTYESFKKDAVTEFQKINEECYRAMSNKMTTLQSSVESIKERLMSLEKDIIQSQRQTHLELVKGRLVLRRTLADFLRKHYINTSGCPLKPEENTIDIGDVYIDPYLEKYVKNSSKTEPGIFNNSLKSYSEIFANGETRLKRIYILGEMGSGKSAFCKMVISNWCNAVRNETLEAANRRDVKEMPKTTTSSNVCMDPTESRECFNDDLTEVLNFEFLFYIPLRRLSGHTNIREMVHHYYKGEVPSDKVLDDVIQNSSERCLIIADGIDEWSPGQCELIPEHVTYGLPHDGGMKQATIVMTSRPSAPGILAMKSTESDQKLILRGIQKTSTEMFVKKYISKLKDQEQVLAMHLKIINILENIKIQNLEQTPLLLQQIVWLLTIGSNIGDSLSEVYSTLLNVALNWTEGRSSVKQITISKENYPDKQLAVLEGKTPEKQITVSDLKSPEKPPTDLQGSLNCLRLPKQLEKYFVCKNNCMLILTLGKASFELFIQHKGSEMAFGRNNLIESGINDELIQKVLKTWLLTEENCLDPTYERTQFSFKHISFLEYFVALYIASHEPGKATASHSREMLEKIFSSASSIEDVISLKNVLIFACGLAPDITHEVCENIYHTASKYDRNYLQDSTVKFTWIRIIKKVEDLVVQCVSECRLNDSSLDLKVPLTTIVNMDNISEALGYVDSFRVLHVVMSNITDKDMFTITDYRNLQQIHILYSNLQHSTITALCQCISSTCSLTGVCIEQIKCHDHEKKQRNHVIDLCRHKNLQYLHYLFTNILRFKHIDATSLEHCITDSSDLLRQVITCRNLKTLKLLEMCLDPADIPKLVTFINQTVSLITLHLSDITCNEACRSHGIDISSHCHLQTLHVVECEVLHVQQISGTNLEHCEIDSVDLLCLVRKSQTLKKLELVYVSYTRDIHDNILLLQHLQELKLSILVIDEGVLVLTQDMNNLKYIELQNVTISEFSWCTFVDSLLTLSQSVTVYMIDIGFFTKREKEKAYVKSNSEKFDMVKETFIHFEFKTLK